MNSKQLIAVVLGLAGAGVLLVAMGAGRDNATFGYQSPPKPGGDWSHALAAACRANDLSESTIESARLQYTMAPRRCYYRAWLTGTRESRRIKVRVELTAPDGGAWVLTEWREE